jgi:hypothetical protein
MEVSGMNQKNTTPETPATGPAQPVKTIIVYLDDNGEALEGPEGAAQVRVVIYKGQERQEIYGYIAPEEE